MDPTEPPAHAGVRVCCEHLLQHQRYAHTASSEREKQLQAQLQAKDREIAALREENAALKVLLRKNQQRSAMLLGQMSASVLGSAGQGIEMG